MPLLFKQSSNPHSSHHHPSYNHFSSTLNNNDSFTNNANKTNNSNNRQHFRSAIKSFSSEQLGDIFGRNTREIINFQSNFQTFLKLFKKFYQKWHLKHLLPLIFVTVYMIFGAILFLWLEEAVETQQIFRR